MHQGRLRNLLEFGSPHLCIVAFALCLMPYSADGAPLKAGVAKVDITPPTGVLMWGYFDRLTPSKATLDPLYARVLVLEVGETRLALVALDLGRAFGPASLVDATVSVLRVDTADGKPLAVLVNYACHPVVFGADNLEYSADFPGVMTATVESQLEQAGGTKPLCFFLQGAPGDINPYYATIPRQEDTVKWRDWTGQRLGEEAARVAKSIRTEPVADPSLQFVED